MKKACIVLLLIISSAIACKKKEEAIIDPLHKRWYPHKIERIYTDKAGNPHPEFQSTSSVVDDKELFLEFTDQGKMLTYEGNGTYTANGNTLSFNLPSGSGEYQYTFQGDMLILSYRVEGITYIEKSIFTMKAF